MVSGDVGGPSRSGEVACGADAVSRAPRSAVIVGRAAPSANVSESALGAAIVSYNTAALLRRCLESVVTDTRGPILVIDNKSSDGSADLVRREFPSVRLRAEEDNRGYGAAANLA